MVSVSDTSSELKFGSLSPASAVCQNDSQILSKLRNRSACQGFVQGLPGLCQGLGPHESPVFIGLPRVPRVPRVLAGGWGGRGRQQLPHSALRTCLMFDGSIFNLQFSIRPGFVRVLSGKCRGSGSPRKARLYWFVKDVKDVYLPRGWGRGARIADCELRNCGRGGGSMFSDRC